MTSLSADTVVWFGEPEASVWHQFTLWLLGYSASFKGETDDLHTLSHIYQASE